MSTDRRSPHSSLKDAVTLAPARCVERAWPWQADLVSPQLPRRAAQGHSFAAQSQSREHSWPAWRQAWTGLWQRLTSQLRRPSLPCSLGNPWSFLAPWILRYSWRPLHTCTQRPRLWMIWTWSSGCPRSLICSCDFERLRASKVELHLISRWSSQHLLRLGNGTAFAQSWSSFRHLHL